MFHFVHNYIPHTDFWNGLIRRGFIDDYSGLKLTQGLQTTYEDSFNRLASPGGEVCAILSEGDRVFFVDRMQGGSCIYPYQYDPELIDFYDELMGKRFLGFQMHEWVSNLLSDFHKIIGDMNAYKDRETSNRLALSADWSMEGIIKAVQKIYPNPGGGVYIEAMSPEEWASAVRPTDAASMLETLTRLFQKRQSAVKQHVLAVDSCFPAERLEAENGVRAIMPEIGAQTPFTRIALALARGTHKACGLPFGAYQEPWGGEPFSCYYYKRDHLNEWSAAENIDSTYAPAGENGGSSLSLYRRICFYAFLAGAEFFAEEWGACNTFYDWHDFELTPYGKVKKEFIDFTRSCPDFGELYTPFALVLPAEMKVLNLNQVNRGRNFFRFVEEFPMMEDQRREQHVYDVLRAIYDREAECPPSPESYNLTNSAFGDLFDLVYEDDPQLFERYEYLADLTGKPEFAAHNAGYSARILRTDEIPALLGRLRELSDRLTGIQVDGAPLWMLHNASGRKMLSFFNNEGAGRSVARGEYQIPGCECRVKITLPSPDIPLRLIFGETPLEREGRELRFTLPPGEILILQMGAGKAACSCD